MSKGYQAENTCIHALNYHFVWCPKYRRKLLINEIKKRLEELIKEKTRQKNAVILELKIMPDHIHFFVSLKPNISPNKFIGEIKGYSSKILRDEFPFLKSRLPSLWTRSYFVSTAGKVSQFTIEKYIREQDKK